MNENVEEIKKILYASDVMHKYTQGRSGVRIERVHISDTTIFNQMRINGNATTTTTQLIIQRCVRP